MKIAIYIIGASLVIGGILFGMITLGVPSNWVLVTGLIAGGIAITSIAGKVITTRQTQAGGNGGETVTKKETTVE